MVSHLSLAVCLIVSSLPVWAQMSGKKRNYIWVPILCGDGAPQIPRTEGLSLHKYLDCIIIRRSKQPANITIFPFEVHFPRYEDMEYAGIEFCTKYTKDLQVKGPSDRKCESSITDAGCEPDKGKLAELERAMNWDMIEDLSCQLMAKYIICTENKFQKCGGVHNVLRDYELVRLGPKCLKRMGLYSPMTAMSREESTLSKGVSSTILAVSSVITCLILL